MFALELNDPFLRNQFEFPEKIVPIDEEASDRKYYVLFYKSQKLILCVYKQDQFDFIELSKFLNKNGILAPKVLKIDSEKKWILQTFEGEKDLSKIQNEVEYTNFISKSIDLICRIQSLKPPEFVMNRKFDLEKYRFELNFLNTHFSLLKAQYDLNVNFNSDSFNFLDKIGLDLSNFHPIVICHRDFHSRNIMINEKDQLVLIDFQDARMGTIFYDLVSILFDPYRLISVESIINLKNQFLQIKNINKNMEDEQLFFKQAIQRLFKALGSYFMLVTVRKQMKYLVSIQNAIIQIKRLKLFGEIPYYIEDYLIELESELHKKRLI